MTVIRKKIQIETGKMRAVAAIREGSYNEENHTIVVDFASEYPVLRYSWHNDEYYNEVLEISEKAIDFSRVAAGASILKDHSRWSVDEVVGVTLRGWIEKGKAVAEIQLDYDEDDPQTVRFVNKVKKKIVRNISVGYTINEYTRTPGKKKGDPAVYRATRWTPDEISFVAVPADPTVGSRNKATARKEADLVRSKSESIIKTTLRMDEDEEEIIETDDEPTAKPVKKTGKKRAKVVTTEDDEDDDDDEPVRVKPVKKERKLSLTEKQAIRNAERDRITQIRSIGGKFGMTEEFMQDAIDDEDMTIDQFRAETMEAWEGESPVKEVKKNRNKMEVKVTDKESENKIAIRSMALAVRSGQIELDSIEDKDFRRAVGAEQKFDLFRTAEQELRRQGHNTDAWSKVEVAQRAIAPDVTSMFPATLNALVNTVYQAKYEEVMDEAWKEIVSFGTLSDFKEYGAIRSWGLANLKVVGEAEEYEQLHLPDAEGERMRLFKYGGIISLSWEAIVNDELGHFSDLVAQLGTSSKRTINDKVWSVFNSNALRGPLMADTKTLWHTDHNNLMAPVATITGDAFDAIRVAMKTTKVDKNGKRISFSPDILLVHPTEFTKAKRYNLSDVDLDVVNKSSLIANPVQGTFKKVLESESITPGYRYVFDQNNRVIRVNFLDGERKPVIDRWEEKRSDALNWKARVVFGVSGISTQGTELLPNA